MVYIIKKDGTKEEFDAQKIVRAVNKSAQRILYTFSQQEIDFICKFATEHVYSLGKTEIPISDMHNIVEGALEKVNPAVAKSYRDYRNYKTDFIHMMDEVYTKSQSQWHFYRRILFSIPVHSHNQIPQYKTVTFRGLTVNSYP